MNKKFIQMLDEGRGRPKKEKSEEDEIPKEKGKRGRPKKTENDKDDSGKEGIRTVTLTAKIKIDGQKEEDTKVLKDFDMNKKVKIDGVEMYALDAEIKKYEKALHKKYKYDADDIKITKKIGENEVDDDAESHMYDTTDDGSDDSDSSFSLGRKDK
jgi:hypothetical protein